MKNATEHKRWIVKKETDPNRQKRLEQIHKHGELKNEKK